MYYQSLKISLILQDQATFKTLTSDWKQENTQNLGLLQVTTILLDMT